MGLAHSERPTVISDILHAIPEGVLGALIVAIVVLMLFIPLALRLAGLSGQQIVDVLTLTLQFFTNLVSEFRSQNKDK